MYTNIFRVDKTNIGDWYSSPNHYFPLNAEITDIWQLPVSYVPKYKNVIYGGGGLVGQMRPMTPVLYTLKQKGYNQFAWGLGDHSFISLDEQTQFIPQLSVVYPAYLRFFDLIGIRDYYKDLINALPQISWVPCVSCMDKLFDNKYDIKHDFVFYTHKTLPLNIVYGMSPETFQCPIMDNQETDLRKVIEFLGSGDTIITSSYHGAYWGLMLGRKVIAFPWCSKFYGLKTHPFFCKPQEWYQNKDKGIQDLNLLSDAREANIKYFEKIQEFIKQPTTIEIDTKA